MMVCEAAAAVFAEDAVEEGWAALVTGVDVVTDALLAAAVAFVARVWLIVAPPWGDTTAESLNCERPSRTVMMTLSADIVVPKVAAFPPSPATEASVDAFRNHCWPCCAYWPVPER